MTQYQTFSDDRAPLFFAKQWVDGHKDEGAICPCCGTLARRYRRKLHTEMGIFLVRLYTLSSHTRRWVKVREIVSGKPKASTDASYLQAWGLVEKDGVGLYRLTDDGARFATGASTAKKYAHVFNGQAEYFSGDDVTIHHVLGDKFNLAELLNPNQ